MMKDNNGFSGKQRERAQRWLNKEWNARRLARPTECVACGQTDGIIQAHAEDYSDHSPGSHRRISFVHSLSCHGARPV